MPPDSIKNVIFSLFLSSWFTTGSASAGIGVSGKTSTFESSNGLVEKCVEIDPMPGAIYSKKDLKIQAEYCGIDFSNSALCPKLWSTSPGTVILEIDTAAYGGSFSAFENQHCVEGHHAKDAALRKLASFKISVNQPDTSATYAPSSWIYYHLSRYFDTSVDVPVAVYRSLDREVHLERVVRPALKIIEGRHGLRMLAAGWKFLEDVESGQDMGSAGQAVLTDENRQVFGTLLDNKGDRYGVDLNGTRESGWGMGQNYDFQQTPAYLALRSPLPLAEGIPSGIHKARANPMMAKKVPVDLEPAQVALWMNELLEITLLDYILGQQDRIGNIDYQWRWFWLENGKVHSHSAHGTTVPDKIAGHNPIRLRRSAINDNDAGVRRGYSNFTMKSGMLENLKHYNGKLYERLARLAQDLQSKGLVYQWFETSSGLSRREIAGITERTVKAFELIHAECTSGEMKLDLDPAVFLPGGNNLAGPTTYSCAPSAQ
jgi:hypothetical protein